MERSAKPVLATRRQEKIMAQEDMEMLKYLGVNLNAKKEEMPKTMAIKRSKS